jgi:flavin reductase (DIM6/NTAB) family NADH-FMN oxidoreductase RutF
VTIHSEHPFADPEPLRDPVRRLRARLGGTVSLWTTGAGAERAGLTVSSVLVAPGEPGRVLGLLDPDSELVDALGGTGTAVVQLLQWRHRDIADAFAGVAPAPGGPFRLAEWEQTAWGPLLMGVTAWAGVRVGGRSREVGWSVLVEAEVEHVGLAESPADADDPGPDRLAPLVHRRGRYVRPGSPVR